MVTRRNFLKSSAGLSALAALPLSVRWSVANAVIQGVGLSDPSLQDLFTNLVPDAMAPDFKYMPDRKGNFKVQIREAMQFTGLKMGSIPVATPVWGYADANAPKKIATWPGKTFEVQSGATQTQVKFQNRLAGNAHLLPVDTNLHWCYSLPGYQNFSIAANGVPTITHLHGGHSDFQYDGNPEFFSNPYEDVIGPQWANVPGGFTTKFFYDNDVKAGNLWYHDHALGLTRLNVYAGLAGFYFVRDDFDTGKPDNPLNLPAWPYEKAYAIQDRMFRETGELFYPAYPGEPAYADFITGEGAILPPDLFPAGGPTALAEFFGDHMAVNGVLWPKEVVEPRNYRLRLLNGTDSRFMQLEMRLVDVGVTDPAAGSVIPFQVIGSDQGLAGAATEVTSLLFEPGSRYDVVVNFKDFEGKRVIMTNILGDAPFGGELPEIPAPEECVDATGGDVFCNRRTDRVMAFDVEATLGYFSSAAKVADPGDKFAPAAIADARRWVPNTNTVTRTRKVALFEGTDEFGRLQPLLGTAEPTVDAMGNTVNGAIAWHMPTTENPGLGDTEIWEIYNATGDAHPIHLHLVNFEILNREGYTADEVPKTVMQHNGAIGNAIELQNIELDGNVVPAEGVERAPKDMVTAYPGTVTRIKATFDKPGRYVWHCHILSHEDHEMMRVLHVGPGA
jgi:FtsP/CotA-like multicopper oxidase with cupredoxin domain